MRNKILLIILCILTFSVFLSIVPAKIQAACSNPDGCFFCDYDASKGCYWNSATDLNSCKTGYIPNPDACVAQGNNPHCIEAELDCIEANGNYRCVTGVGCVICDPADKSAACYTLDFCNATCNKAPDPGVCTGNCRKDCQSGEIEDPGKCSLTDTRCCVVESQRTTPVGHGECKINLVEFDTAIGCISMTLQNNLLFKFILSWAIGVASGVAFLLVIYSGFLLTTSAGDPKRVQAGKELLGAAIGGLLLLIFAIVILRVIGVDILGILPE